MSNKTTQWILELVDHLTAPLRAAHHAADGAKEAVNDVADAVSHVANTGSKLPNLAADISSTAFAFNQVSDAVGKFNQEFQDSIAPGVDLETRMAKLSTISGKTGDDLESLKKTAKELGIEFGVGASAMAESFMDTIGSLGDSFGESEEALGLMGRNIGILSKLMDGDAKGAANALSTAMLQYGVDLKNPIAAAQEATRMMNIMQAAANVGGSEVVDTAEALRQSGLLAKQSGLSFEELNASLEGLAKGKIVAGEAGTAMRNILLSMSTLGNAPKEVVAGLKHYGVNMALVADPTVKFTDRLRELKKIQNDSGLMESVFMKANIAAGQTILNNIDTIDEWTVAVTGTNAATEGAAVIQDTYAETMAKVKATVDGYKESVFSAIEPIVPFISITGDAMGAVTNMGFAVFGLSTLLKKDLWIGLFSVVKGIASFVVSAAVGTVSAIKFALAGGLSFSSFAVAARVACTTVSTAIYSIPIIGWIAAAIAAIAALVIYFYNTSSAFRGFLWGVWGAIKAVFTGIGGFIKEVLTGVWETIKFVFNPANWFSDDVNFTDGLNRIENAAKMYGESIGKAFQEGKSAGIADFEASKTEEAPGEATAENKTRKTTVGIVKPKEGDIKTENGITYRYNAGQWISQKANPKGGGGGDKSLKLAGNGGSGGGKSVTMNVTMHNHFTGVKNVDEMVDTVVRKLNDKLNDSLAAV